MIACCVRDLDGCNVPHVWVLATGPIAVHVMGPEGYIENAIHAVEPAKVLMAVSVFPAVEPDKQAKNAIFAGVGAIKNAFRVTEPGRKDACHAVVVDIQDK